MKPFSPKRKSGASADPETSLFNAAGSSVALTIVGPRGLISTQDSGGLPITYTTIVHPEGGTFNWSFDDSGKNDAITFVGETNNSSVVVQSLINKWSKSKQGNDQIIKCEYTFQNSGGSSQKVKAIFEITVVRPAKLALINPGEDLHRPLYTEKNGLIYQVQNDYGGGLHQIYPITPGTDTVRVISQLYISEDVIKVKGPSTPQFATNLELKNSGKFKDSFRLTNNHDWELDQRIFCHAIKWTDPDTDSGNLIRKNKITYEGGADDAITVEEVKK